MFYINEPTNKPMKREKELAVLLASLNRDLSHAVDDSRYTDDVVKLKRTAEKVLEISADVRKYIDELDSLQKN